MNIELSEQEQLRRQSLKALRELGINPYPAARFEVNATAKQIAEEYDAQKGNYSEVSIAGRIMSRRIMGKASFCNIQDTSANIQSYVRRDDVGEEPYAQFKKMDIGDIVGLEGFVFKTQTGEISVHATEIKYKALPKFPASERDLAFSESSAA